MSMSRLITLVTLLALCFVAVAPQDAMARSRGRSKKSKKVKEDPKNALIIQALGSLKWGDSKDDVVTKLRTEAMDEARKDPKLKTDRVRMQKAMKLIRDRSKKFDDTYTKLEGSTNLDVSVIGDEFITDNGESYLRVVDSRSQRYFFFMRNRLYKYVVAYNRNYLENVSFNEFIGATAEKYGRPTDATFDEEDEEELVSVEWKTKNVILVVKNKQRFFGTYTMTFAEPRLYEAWATRKKSQDDRRQAQDKVPSEVRSLLQTGDVQISNSAVTSIVGNTDVDIKSVIPKDKSEEEARKKAEAEKKKKAAEAAKKKKKRSKRKRRKKGGDLDLKLDSTPSKGLIIY